MTSQPRFADFATAFVLALAFFYVCVRAASLSITHDEALTYLIHVPGSLTQIFLHSLPLNSNNHLLNTLLIKVGTAAFGVSPLTLRAPALAGCVLYLVGTWLTLRLVVGERRRLLLAGLFATNPFLIDFFGLARGYSLGIGFSMLGLYFLLARHFRACPAPRRDTALAIVSMSLAVLSNLAFINLLLAAAATMGVIEIKGGVRHAVRTVVVPTAAAGTVLATIYNPAVIARIRLNLVGWGGTNGFWIDTIGSIVEHVMYGRRYFGDATVLLGFSVIVAVLLIGSAMVLHGWLAKTDRDPLVLPTAAILAILVLVGLSLTLQPVATGTRYTVDRGAIFLVPPFLILIALTWEYASRHASVSFFAARVALGAMATSVTLHGIVSANTTHTFLWRYDAGTKAALQTIDQLHTETAPGRPARLGINWVFEPASNFYRLVNHMSWLERVDRDGPDRTFDYYYLMPTDVELLEKRNLRVVSLLPESGAILAVPR